MALFDRPVSHLPDGLLRDTFGWSPFSILNTITSDWQRHRNEWLYMLPKSTEGRDVKRFNATPTNTFSARGAQAKEAESISMFDPFLCELMYKWFSTQGMTVLDPFAGGSVRGLVAESLNRNYIGIDLSSDQVYINRLQQKEFHTKYTGIPGKAEWVLGDANDIDLLLEQHESDILPSIETRAVEKNKGLFDMIFTCPPYYNLEKYTDNPADLSRLPSYEVFLSKFTEILKRATANLKDDAFCVIIVSEVRADPADLSRSHYLGLVPDTIHILRDECNLQYYNEIILENNIGSLPIRAPKYFNQSRKIGRHHQNILVFYKGNIAHIPAKFGSLKDC